MNETTAADVDAADDATRGRDAAGADAADPDAVHAIVPIATPDQRQAVAAARGGPVEGAAGVVVQRERVVGRGEAVEAFVFIRPEIRRAQERHVLVQHGHVTASLDVVRRHEREPDQVVGDAGPDPAAVRGKPPVQDVALLELVARGLQ
jgi:hypothetical protein